MPLGAAVITLPDHAEWLSEALADLGEPRTESGRVVASSVDPAGSGVHAGGRSGLHRGP
jgi:hypothetical protein